MSMFEPWIRNSFEVQAVRITGDNIQAVATWCGGTIGKSSGEHPKLYVLVNTQQYNKLMQSKAYVGDWVILIDDRFKHYRDESFRAAFHPKVTKFEDVLALVEGAMGGNSYILDPFGEYLRAEDVAREITKLFEEG